MGTIKVSPRKVLQVLSENSALHAVLEVIITAFLPTGAAQTRTVEGRG